MSANVSWVLFEGRRNEFISEVLVTLAAVTVFVKIWLYQFVKVPSPLTISSHSSFKWDYKSLWLYLYLTLLNAIIVQISFFQFQLELFTFKHFLNCKAVIIKFKLYPFLLVNVNKQVEIFRWFYWWCTSFIKNQNDKWVTTSFCKLK